MPNNLSTQFKEQQKKEQKIALQVLIICEQEGLNIHQTKQVMDWVITFAEKSPLKVD